MKKTHFTITTAATLLSACGSEKKVTKTNDTIVFQYPETQKGTVEDTYLKLLLKINWMG
jgi:hypothetical protein